jgi:hypothetical protein
MTGIRASPRASREKQLCLPRSNLAADYGCGELEKCDFCCIHTVIT